MEYKKEDPETIQNMFGSIAKQYDRTNAVLSMLMHKQWNRSLVEAVIGKSSPDTILDLCCGTGEIALNYLKDRKENCETYLIDFCPEMLSCARDKADKMVLNRHLIHYIEADAQAIPLSSQSIDCATMAYGIRNIKDPQKSLHEVYRVLQPNGRLGILELTQPKNRVLRFGHSMYLRYLLPIMGRFLTSNKDAYQYLCNSIHAFVPPETLEEMLKSAGFSNTRRIPLAGGIATIVLGTK